MLCNLIKSKINTGSKIEHFLIRIVTKMPDPDCRNIASSDCLYRNRMSKGFVKNKLHNERVNKFYQDKGERGEMNLLNIDKDDPAFHPEHFRSDTDIADLQEESMAFKKEYKIQKDPEKTRRIMMKKNMFPQKQEPHLLTFMERETIRYLHRKDPNDWTVDKLAESFPASHRAIKAVIKSKGVSMPASMRKIDEAVADNWKKLSNGELEIDPELKSHLKSFKRKPLSLSRQDNEMISKRLNNIISERSRPKLVAEPGEFTKILTDYQHRVKQLEREKKQGKQQNGEFLDSFESEHEMASLFGDGGLDSTPAVGSSTPYGETAIFDFGMDYSRDPNMDIERFREIYLNKLNPALDQSRNKTSRPFRNEKSGKSYAMEAYASWLAEKEAKSRLVTKNVTKVDAEEILKSLPREVEVEESKHRKYLEEIQELDDPEVRSEIDAETGDSRVYVITPQGRGQSITMESSPDFIEIPAHLKHKYHFFQYGDSFYDSEGEFMYRVPGLTTSN